MTVIVKSLEKQEIILYSKGADEVMFTKISQNEDNKHLISKAKDVNDKFAQSGLRVLIMAKKYLSLSTFTKWFKKYNTLLGDMSLSQTVKINKINAIYEEIEDNLIYLGTSAIEDKLQDVTIY
jgi:magnesium-transporting ATPase (P-type)